MLVRMPSWHYYHNWNFDNKRGSCDFGEVYVDALSEVKKTTTGIVCKVQY